MENNQQESLFQMHLDFDGGHILRETVRWSRFLSIVGIIFLSIFVLVLVFAGSLMLNALSKLAPGMEGMGVAVSAIIIPAVVVGLAIGIFLVYMLYRFSTLTRKGVEQQDQAVFSEGMKCLKLYFLVSGIIAILGLLGNLLSLTKLF